MGLGSFLGNLFTGGASGASKAADQGLAQQNYLREQAKRDRMANLGNYRAPTMTGSYSARIKALQEDALDTPLSQNRSFQGDRANLVTDARQEVAGIQNKQQALGVGGGFSNIGSTQDAYDRLSAGLAGLGQQANQRRDQASQQAAELDQGFQDRQTEFANAQAQLRDAIIAGDLDAAMAAYDKASSLKAQASTAGYGALGSMLGSIGGALLSGGTSIPVSAALKAGKQAGSTPTSSRYGGMVA